MDKNAQILKRIMKTKTEDVLHTSAYAKSQNAQGFGAASNVSFGERKAIEDRRKFVQGYRNSRIMAGTGYTTPRARTYTSPASGANSGVGSPAAGASLAARSGRSVAPAPTSMAPRPVSSPVRPIKLK